MADKYVELLGTIEGVHLDDLELISRRLSIRVGAVLDVGCGPGHLTDHLRSLGVDAIGIDQVEAFIEHARTAYPSSRFELGALHDLPVPDHSLAGALAWYSLIHLRPDEIDDVLAELRRAMATGATLVVGFFDGDRCRGVRPPCGDGLSLASRRAQRAAPAGRLRRGRTTTTSRRGRGRSAAPRRHGRGRCLSVRPSRYARTYVRGSNDSRGRDITGDTPGVARGVCRRCRERPGGRGCGAGRFVGRRGAAIDDLGVGACSGVDRRGRSTCPGGAGSSPAHRHPPRCVDVEVAREARQPASRCRSGEVVVGEPVGDGPDRRRRGDGRGAHRCRPRPGVRVGGERTEHRRDDRRVPGSDRCRGGDGVRPVEGTRPRAR